MALTPTTDVEWTIPLLLAESARLSATLPALFTWNELREIISRCDLGALKRHPDLEKRYLQFNALVRAQHGTTEDYLRVQLGWNAEDGDEMRRKALERGEGDWWKRDSVVQVRRNDWAYGVPADVGHWVAWTPLPLLHPGSCEGSATPWEEVAKLGLTGFTGDDGSLPGFGADPTGPGREIHAFVKSRWSDSKWETAWFVNPPSLQSVKGLAHFHCLVRKKRWGAGRTCVAQ
ncbi:hypothetical protein RQP46_007107 [Phenoliferia psychrophenolica]